MNEQALNKAVWLASYMRSGNTWLRCLFEAYFCGRVDIRRLRVVKEDFHERRYQAVCNHPVDKLEDGLFVAYRPAMLANMLRSGYQLIKTHHANVAMDFPLIPASLTDRAIYIIRDPRDVALSWANHYDCSVDEAIGRMANPHYQTYLQAAPSIRNFVSSWSVHVRTWVDQDVFPVHVVRYEDMANPDTFAGVLEWLGQPGDSAAECLQIARFDGLQQQEKAKGFDDSKPNAFFNRGIAGLWKQDPMALTREQVDRIQSVHGEVMQQHGYELV